MPFQVKTKSYGVQKPSNSPILQQSPNPTKPRIAPRGNYSERLWIVAEAALPKDADKGYMFSSALGWNWQKVLDANDIRNCCITSLDCWNTQDEFKNQITISEPPVLIVLDSALEFFFPGSGMAKSLTSWAGSILTSPVIQHRHYIIPTFGPSKCVEDWIERQIVQSVDIAKAKGELDFWLENDQTLNPLPERTLVTDLNVQDLIEKFEKWEDDAISYLSVDIESIYPREKSQFFGHPGYPVIVGIAPNPHYGISFNLWPEDRDQARRLWFRLAKLLSKKKIIGQNFDMFDSRHFDMLGMPIETYEELLNAKGTSRIFDTRLRHAVLWPELPHSLQFQTRQYTRQPYYKDEGKGWNPKDMTRWMRYNALDCCTTYEVFLAQEEEFNERPYLR